VSAAVIRGYAVAATDRATHGQRSTVAVWAARLVLKAAARDPGHRDRAKIGPPDSAAPDQATGPDPVRARAVRSEQLI
jgi:hypothetical protein